MLEARNISFSYGEQKILHNICLVVEKGQIVSVVGPNGAGKSTLLMCIAAIRKPKEGVVFIDGINSSSLSTKDIAKYIAYLPQGLVIRFPVTVFETILSGRRPHFSWKPSRRDIEKVEHIIKKLNLSPFADRYVDQLSGGQRQKVLLARALVQDTPYLLLDEPNTGLDLRHQIELLEIVTCLARKKKVGVLMSIHDLNLAARFSDRLLMLHCGKIIAKGVPFEVLTAERIRNVYGVEAKVIHINNQLNVFVTGRVHQNVRNNEIFCRIDYKPD